jgi:ATP-dependent Lhr-like helicase
VARSRNRGDWERDRREARPVERRVEEALRDHRAVSYVADFSTETEDLDFQFRLDGAVVRMDVKEKKSVLSDDFAAVWPEVPSAALFVLDETAFRTLVWPEGMGYVVIHDRPMQQWHVFGPWELLLGPHRRCERLGDKGNGAFPKGKLLIDMRTAARTTPDLSIDALVEVVRASRKARSMVRAFSVPGQRSLPLVGGVPPERHPPEHHPPERHPPEHHPPERPGVRPASDAGGKPAPTDESVDPRWVGLDPDLVAAVKAAWGWDEPTPVQALAIPHVLAGKNTLIVAPTAGGKTEAALLPVLHLRRTGAWRSPSILAISPLKALLDDQLLRYQGAARLIDATAFAWHGDVGRALKNAFEAHPADVLLTTPESLERLLSQPGLESGDLLSSVRTVIVDEVHAFVGSPRGAQLAAQLERLDQLAGTDIQRIGLSATIGNPDAVLVWLAGSSLRDAVVVQPGQRLQGEELAISSYENVAEAATIISEAIEGKRALIFTSSRRRAEQLAAVLDVAVHHSSVAADRRTGAIDKLQAGVASCLIATSGLEMGLDIGDIDLVVNDGAPGDPSAYLQRLGRSGRRDGNRRMLVTVGDPDSLLLTLAVVARSRRGTLDHVPAGRGARLVLGQQAVLFAFERLSYTVGDLREYLRFSPLFRPLTGDIDDTVEHLVATGWLALVGRDNDTVVVGPSSQVRFGGKGIYDLLATFETAREASVVTAEGHPVGTLDWSEVVSDSGEVRTGPVSLAGRRWQLTSIDRAAGLVSAVPAPDGTDAARLPSWRGPSREVGRMTWEAAREILDGTDVDGVAADDRVRQWLADMRDAWAPRLANPVRSEAGLTVVDSFAGGPVQRAVLAATGIDGTVDGPTLRFQAAPTTVASRATELLADLDSVFAAEAVRRSAVVAIRHRELVAPSVLLAEARQYHVDEDGIKRTLQLMAGARRAPEATNTPRPAPEATNTARPAPRGAAGTAS